MRGTMYGLWISWAMLTGSAWSQEEVSSEPPGAERLMRALDTDRSGELSPAEIAAAPEALQALDANGDGRLAPKEWTARRPLAQYEVDLQAARKSTDVARAELESTKSLARRAPGSVSDGELRRLELIYQKMQLNEEAANLERRRAELEEAIEANRSDLSAWVAARIFAAQDKNGDGKVSQAEAPEDWRNAFDRIDSNGDGSLDSAEVRAFARGANR